MNSPEHSIAGTWQGTSAEADAAAAKPPVRFQVTWAMHDSDEGRFTGTLLEDGPPDEADTAQTDGMQSGRQVAFTKVSINHASSLLHPAAYEGTLSEDGAQISGTWRLADVSGTWEARRVENAAAIKK